ncbi:MAG: zinc-ribbon and FHA domain-containing protein [Actinomycetota bacterium]|nr:zinc-ribbon and FHA domain-containing protein [Actinomycetota bacterium]
MADVFCNQCGHRNVVGANFCSSCGAVLEPQPGDDTTITFAPVESAGEVAEEELTVTLGEFPDSTAMVVVKRGPNAGSKFALDTDVTRAGRHPESDIFLDDITVSRRHAEVIRVDDGYTIRDVGSLNGTYLNRERIEEAALANGDELQIGKFRLVFFSGTAGED